jgi:hypothetical protein
MIDKNTFLTTLYVMSDDFCKTHLPPEAIRPGCRPSLSRSEVLTLAIFSQWYPFRNQRDFYRQNAKSLRAAFPSLPSRPQFNRLVRTQREAIVAFGLHLGVRLGVQRCVYEVLDTTGVPVRNVKRRGRGWLGGLAKIGWCTREGWFNGFRLLISTSPHGAITGFGFGEGSAKEQPMTEVFLGLRCHPDARLPSVGSSTPSYYLADKGFAGRKNQTRWQSRFGARLICEPQTHAKPWPKPWQRWLRHYRQIVETAYDKLIHFFRLTQERPHDLSGFQANLAAKIALHNFCIWLNQQLGRPALAFADLLDWQD